jgi:uncharacterized protein (TIGR02145 family)
MKHIYLFIFLLLFCSLGYSQKPCPGVPTVKYAGKTYHTLQIGSQCWLKENLNVGTMISGTNSQTNNGIIEKYCYNNDPANCTAYGGLYQWAEAVQYKNGANNISLFANPPLTGNVQGICPTGWHIPTEDEFETLVNTVDDGANALRVVELPPERNTNTSGFSALMVGQRASNDQSLKFFAMGYQTWFWSSTEVTMGAYHMYLDYDDTMFEQHDINKFYGLSVRCVKDF